MGGYDSSVRAVSDAIQKAAVGLEQRLERRERLQKSESLTLCAEAEDAIFRSLEDGRAHGYKGDWTGVEWSEQVHIEHAYAHLQGAKGTDPNSAEHLEHLQHALCRIAMALVRAQEFPCQKE